MDSKHLREIARILAHKWDLTILTILVERPLRYTDLVHAVREVDSDLAEGVLSRNLKRLAANGLILQQPIDKHRHVWDLTPYGRDMVEILSRITDLDDRGPSPDERDPDGDDRP